MFNLLKKNADDARNGAFMRSMLPSLIMMILTCTLADTLNTLIASHYSAEALSGIGQASSVFQVFTYVLGAHAVGCMVAVSVRCGAGKQQTAGECIESGILVGLPVVALFMFILIVFRGRITELFFAAAEPGIKEACREYLFWGALTLPSFLINSQYSNALRGAGDALTPFIVDLTTCGIGVLLGWLLMYGIIGQPMGVRGLGIALLVWRVVATFMYIVVGTNLRSKAKLHTKPITRWRPSLSVAKELLVVAVPVAIEYVLFYVGKLFIQVIVTDFGTSAISANQILSSLQAVLIVPLTAMTNITTALIGRNLGGRSESGLHNAFSFMLRRSYLFAIGLGIICSGLSWLLPRAYTDDPEVIALVRRVLVFMGPSLLAWVWVFIRSNTLYGVKDSKFVSCVNVISMWVFRIPMSFLLGRYLGWGLNALWGIMFVEWVTSGTIFALRMRKDAWVRRALSSAEPPAEA